MASAGNRPGDRHRHPPIAYRPPADAREILARVAEQTGRPISSLITEAVREHFGIAGAGDPPSSQ